MAPFLWMGFHCLKVRELLHGDNLLFATKSLGCPGTHLINLERLSRPWSHPVALNLRPLDWESSAFITWPLFQVSTIKSFATIVE